MPTFNILVEICSGRSFAKSQNAETKKGTKFKAESRRHSLPSFMANQIEKPDK